MVTKTAVKPKSTKTTARAATSKRHAVEEAEEVIARVSTRAKKVKETVDKLVSGFNPMAGIDDTLDSIEKHYGLSGSAVDADEVRTSTGLLALDIVLGRGFVPGWYTLFGPEQSCKSTGASTLMAAALLSEVPVIAYWDYEGSSSATYIESIINTMGFGMNIKNVMGLRDTSGKWIIKPRVRFYSEGVGEKFFDYLAMLERKFPDKVKMNGKWYYVYEAKTAEGKIHKENFALVGKNYDEVWYKKTGKLRVPAPNGSLQALVIVDSYPAMLPEKQDVDDPNSAIAVQARMFAEQLRRVKGKMKSKRICVVGVNQLRKAPMAMFSNPETEPCGEALKFFSDCRLRMYPRASGMPGGPKLKGMIEREESATHEGKDKYRYIHVRAAKNKLSVPNLECWFRLWITDAEGTARGFDPVWDTWYYLKVTGQATGKRSLIKLTLGDAVAKRSLPWIEFKTLILGDKAQRDKIWAYIGMKPRDLRKWCFKQLSTGDGMDRFLMQQRADEAGEKDDE